MPEQLRAIDGFCEAERTLVGAVSHLSANRDRKALEGAISPELESAIESCVSGSGLCDETVSEIRGYMTALYRLRDAALTGVEDSQ